MALLDEWAARFFEELDYIREGNNGTRFAASMAKDLPQVKAMCALTVRHAVHSVPQLHMANWSGVTVAWRPAGAVVLRPDCWVSWQQLWGRDMAQHPAEVLAVSPQVVVPETYHELTSRRVLTTGWVEGEKLSQSTADDVGDLVNVGVISYLKQLLDTGFFHVSACRPTSGAHSLT